MTSYRLHLADEPMSYTVFATLPEALAECRALWGAEMDCETQGRRTLVWASFADAENDDGSNAVAEIIEVPDEVCRLDVPLSACDTLDAALTREIDHWSEEIRSESEHYSDDDMAGLRLRIAQAKALQRMLWAQQYEIRNATEETR